MNYEDWKLEMEMALKHFKKEGISSDPKKPGKLQHVLDYQDLIGHAQRNDIAQFEGELDATMRGNFHWANCHTLAQEIFLDIVRMTATRLASDEISHLCDQLNKANESVSANQEAHANILHECNQLVTAKDILERDYDALANTVSELKAERDDLRAQLVSYQIDTDSLTAENKEYLKKLL